MRRCRIVANSHLASGLVCGIAARTDFLRMPGDPAIGCSEHLSRAPTLRGRFLQAKGAAKSRMLRADATKLTLVGTLSNSATGSPDSLARLPHIALPCSDCPPHRRPSHYMRRRPGSTFHTHLASLMPAPWRHEPMHCLDLPRLRSMHFRRSPSSIGAVGKYLSQTDAT